MKLIMRFSALFMALLFNLNVCHAQDATFTKTYKKEVINNISQMLNDFYVFPEVAKFTEEHLKKQLAEGYFDAFENNETFALALTNSVQSVSKDKHMRIWANQSSFVPEMTQERMFEDLISRIDRYRVGNAGFNTVEILEGNVGYLDLRGFAGMETGKDMADSYMKLMSRVDAMIIDLSKNGGGSPSMVQYVCSYFFNEKLLLNSLYWREGDITQEFWTLDEVGGLKMPDIPLFIITSERTFSGAEEFSYNMQTQKRATLVGQTTGGGANPGGSRNINESLRIFIPTGRAINPITETNWEGVGVVPEIKTTVDEAFHTTLDLAQKAAEAYRVNRNDRFQLLFSELHNTLDNYIETESDNLVLESLKQCKEAQLFNEGDINSLGYDYLMSYNKPKEAEAILRANTMLYPNSANAFDSYGESLMLNGNLEASLENYQKAVAIAVSNEDGNLELFQKNLENIKQKLKQD